MAKDCCRTNNKMLEKKRLIDPFLAVIILITTVMLLGIVAWGMRLGGQAEAVKADSQVELAIETAAHDWGTIDIEGGVVTKEFSFENNGSAPLKLYNIKSSCDCTTAQMVIGGTEYRKIGMHDNDSTIYEVAPGEEAEIRIEFDPMFHGPSGVGPITRLIAVNTNDPKVPVMQFRLSANVVKN